MHKTFALMGAALLVGTAVSAAEQAPRSWKESIAARFQMHDKRMCRWDAPTDGEPACRILDVTSSQFTRPTEADRLNGWNGQQKITFRAVYFNGQIWSEAYQQVAIFVRTSQGWQLRYSSMGNGQGDLAMGMG